MHDAAPSGWNCQAMLPYVFHMSRHARRRDVAGNTEPTLSQVVPLYSDAELVRLIRYGLQRDVHSAVGMTSYAFWSPGDQEVSKDHCPTGPKGVKLPA
jgi:hypothetical protein